jgi:hypothetical protein
MLGAVVMTLTMAAATALLSAVADSWAAAEAPQSTRVNMSRGSNRFLEMIKSAKYLGWAGRRGDGSGSAVLLWERDEESVGWMQLSEIALLEFEAGPKTLTLYRVPATASNANWLCDVGDIDEELDVPAFKKSANVVAQVVLHDVADLDPWIQKGDAAKGRPSIEYELRVESGRDRSWGYQTVTLRAPAQRPVKCQGDSSCTCTKSGGCVCVSGKSCACSATAPCRLSTVTGCCAAPAATSEATAK